MTEPSLDVTGTQDLEITIRSDGKVLWVNSRNGCLLRVCRIEGEISIVDERPMGRSKWTGEITDWTLVQHHLRGRIWKDSSGRFEDGSWITTSPLVSMFKFGESFLAITQSGSTYLLKGEQQ